MSTVLEGAAADLSIPALVARTLVVLAFTILLLRCAKSRFLARHSALDVVVGIMLGSILSRTINSAAERARCAPPAKT
jgi:uncharacterized membrane protein YcaP (DUF421 family)